MYKLRYSRTTTDVWKCTERTDDSERWIRVVRVPYYVTGSSLLLVQLAACTIPDIADEIVRKLIYLVEQQ